MWPGASYLKPWFRLWHFLLLLTLPLICIKPSYSMEYCCHTKVGTPNCYLDMFNYPKKQVCRTVSPTITVLLNPWLIINIQTAFRGLNRSLITSMSFLAILIEVITVDPTLAASLEPLAHCQNVTSLSLFCGCNFGRLWSKLAELVPLPYYCRRSTCYFNWLHDFFVTISQCYKYVYVNSNFPCTASFWNFLPEECFPLTYDLNGFKSTIHKPLLSLNSFLITRKALGSLFMNTFYYLKAVEPL